MTDPRHASDTFFLLAAEDWRLHEADQFPQKQLLQAFMAEADMPLNQSPGHIGTSSSQLTAAVAEDCENSSQYLEDLVRI